MIMSDVGTHLTHRRTTRNEQVSTRAVNTTLVEEYADQIRPLLPLARRAYGTQSQGTPAREASDKVNDLILEYADKRGGNVTHLARELRVGDNESAKLSLAGVRRRLRVARGGNQLGQASTTGHLRGSRDPARVKAAASAIETARDQGTASYRIAVEDVKTSGVSLAAVAKELDLSYYSLYSVMNSGTVASTSGS